MQGQGGATRPKNRQLTSVRLEQEDHRRHSMAASPEEGDSSVMRIGAPLASQLAFTGFVLNA